jgi:uncharacterized protein (TIGR02453 family)
MPPATTPTRFAGFPTATFAWFAGMEANNSRAWFHANRETFDEHVRGALEALLDELAAELGGEVKVFRQHRDVRFSRDKSPYKTRTYGLIFDRQGTVAGLYAEISSAGFFAGTGYHTLDGGQLERFREAVADDPTGPQLEDAVAAAHAAGVETFGEALKTAPRGFPRDHPRAGLLRHKSLIAGVRRSPGARGITRA